MMMMKIITTTRAMYSEESSDSEPDNEDAESQSESGPNANEEVSDDESVDEDMLVETAGEDDRSEGDESVNEDVLVETADEGVEEIAGVPTPKWQECPSPKRCSGCNAWCSHRQA